MGSVPGSGRSLGGGNGNPLWYSCLGKSHGHGHRSLVGYSPKGHKELDTTERLSMRAHAHPQYLCFSFFREPPYSFLWRLCQFTFPPAVEEGSFFSMPSVDPFFIRSFIQQIFIELLPAPCQALCEIWGCSSEQANTIPVRGSYSLIGKTSKQDFQRKTLAHKLHQHHICLVSLGILGPVPNKPQRYDAMVIWRWVSTGKGS